MASFEGTPAECVSWLQTYFAIQEKMVEGGRSTAKTDDDAERFDELLDVVGRSVYRVDVEGLGMVARQRVRPEHMARVTRMETGLELFDMLSKDKSKESD